MLVCDQVCTSKSLTILGYDDNCPLTSFLSEGIHDLSIWMISTILMCLPCCSLAVQRSQKILLLQLVWDFILLMGTLSLTRNASLCKGR
jgi:hypothetical protein